MESFIFLLMGGLSRGSTARGHRTFALWLSLVQLFCLLVKNGDAFLPIQAVRIVRPYTNAKSCYIGLWGRNKGGLGQISTFSRPCMPHVSSSTHLKAKSRAGEEGIEGLAGSGKVLVVGATGRIGRLIVHDLLNRGVSVKAMTRDTRSESCIELLKVCEGMGGLEIVEGNVANYSTVEEAIEGCRTCVACHSSVRPTNMLKDSAYKVWDPVGEMLGAWGPSRPDVVPADWGEDFSWLDPGTEESHPWNAHYAGVCHLVDAAEDAACRHIVLVSDVMCGLPPIHPDAVRRKFVAWYEIHSDRLAEVLDKKSDAFTPRSNLRFSMGLKWRCEGEVVLRQAAEEMGLKYTIIRVPELTDDPVPPAGMQLVTAHNGKTAQGSRLSRQAVASLCIEALSNPLSHNATVSCAWGVSSRAYGEEGGQPEGGADNLSSVFVGADTYENTRRAHSHTVGAVVWGSLGSVVLSLVLAGVITMERIDKAVKFGPWIAVPSFIYARKRDRKYWPGQDRPEPDYFPSGLPVLKEILKNPKAGGRTPRGGGW